MLRYQTSNQNLQLISYLSLKWNYRLAFLNIACSSCKTLLSDYRNYRIYEHLSKHYIYRENS